MMHMTFVGRSRRFCAAMAIGGLVAVAVPVLAANPIPGWAYLVPDAPQPVEAPRTGTFSASGSSVSLTQAQIDDNKNPPDWYPGQHAPLAAAVRSGGAPVQQKACAACHLVSGMGHPEAGALAGLPFEYLKRQISEFRSGERANDFTPGANERNDLISAMAAIAKAWPDAEMDEALRYYAAAKPIAEWVKVVESVRVPKSYVRRSYARFELPGGETELLGQRIIELPADAEAWRLRDPNRSGTIAYVPVGSIAHGRALAASCAGCHGMDERGMAGFPPLAGRSPLYAFRQLFMFQQGSRHGAMAGLMKAQVSDMSERDMIDVSAFLATMKP